MRERRKEEGGDGGGSMFALDGYTCTYTHITDTHSHKMCSPRVFFYFAKCTQKYHTFAWCGHSRFVH